jgi:hypothetical protein
MLLGAGAPNFSHALQIDGKRNLFGNRVCLINKVAFWAYDDRAMNALGTLEMPERRVRSPPMKGQQQTIVLQPGPARQTSGSETNRIAAENRKSEVIPVSGQVAGTQTTLSNSNIAFTAGLSTGDLVGNYFAVGLKAFAHEDAHIVVGLSTPGGPGPATAAMQAQDAPSVGARYYSSAVGDS